jgi:hypothetical protein
MNYNDLLMLPKLNGCTIIGDRTFADYGIVPLSSSDITEMQLEIFGYVL